MVLAFNVLAHAAVGVYRFEDLRVWQAAKQQCDRVGALLKRPQFLGDRELSSQINDASLSVIFNISEGFCDGATGRRCSFCDMPSRRMGK